MSDRPKYCCGACPGIEGGGYDCTCLYSDKCPKRKELGMLHNLRWRWGIRLHRLLEWLPRRYKGLRGGQDD